MGYADMTGADGHNDTLSGIRAQHVKEYLLSNGLGKASLKLCTGKGSVKRNVAVPPGGFPEDRRVDIFAQSGVLHKIASPAPGESKPFSPETFTHAKKGEAFTLDKIYFYRGNHTIRETSYPQIEELYKLMVKSPKLKIQLEGHVCCVPIGHDADDEGIPQMIYTGDTNNFMHKHIDPNSKDFKIRVAKNDGYVFIDHPEDSILNPDHLQPNTLSVNRAFEVYKYLINKGINANRLSYTGFGSSRHAVPETTAEGSRKNMRVEVRIMGQ